MNDTSQSPLKGRITILLICAGIFAIGQFHRASGGVFSPILIEQLAVSATAVGSLVSAMFLANIAAQLPFGYALDRYGPKPVLTLCLVVIAIGTLVFALGGFRLDVLTGSRILIGLGSAAMGAATNVIIARSFPSRDFGYISGLVVTLGGIGGLLGTYPLAFALERLPWSLVFSIAAFGSVLLALFVLLCFKPQSARPVTQSQAAPNEGYLTLLRKREFQKILTLQLVAYAPITTITGLWGGPYLQDVQGLSAEVSGALLLVMFLATISAGYGFGILDRRVNQRYRLILSAVVVSGGSLLMLAIYKDAPPFIAVALLLVMIFSQQFYVPLGAHMRRITPDNLMGRASTLVTLSGVAGIPLMQTAFGIVLDIAKFSGLDGPTQYRLGFAMIGVSVLLAGAIYATAKDVNPEPEDG